MEVQCETPSGPYHFIPQSTAFYHFVVSYSKERVSHLLQHNYDNFVYGIFRTDALFHHGEPVTRWLGPTHNEIPMLVLIAEKGDIRVIPEIGMRKHAAEQVCKQAHWEEAGGVLPNWPGWLRYLKSVMPLRRYH